MREVRKLIGKIILYNNFILGTICWSKIISDKNIMIGLIFIIVSIICILIDFGKMTRRG